MTATEVVRVVVACRLRGRQPMRKMQAWSRPSASAVSHKTRIEILMFSYKSLSLEILIEIM